MPVSRHIMHMHFIITGPGSVGILKSSQKAALSESTQTDAVAEESDRVQKAKA